MASNHDRIGKALELLVAGLQPYVQRELKSHLGEGWDATALASLPSPVSRVNWNDPKVLLDSMWQEWNRVFRNTLGSSERNLVRELLDVRNKWAHRETFSSRDTLRYLDSMIRLLSAVSASEEMDAIEQMYTDLQRFQFEQQRRNEMRKKSYQPTEGRPSEGLKPWRQVVTPHHDVITGQLKQSEFAADLWQVYQGEGPDEYRHPTEFFRRTFLTGGISELLKGTLQRLAGTGGDPVVELQTNFGGGKTHTLLALYHMFSGADAAQLPGVEELVNEVGVAIPKGVRRAVIVGNRISPGKPHKKPDGTVVRTLWGEIAWQLGGREGYEMVREDDQRATNPGDTLTQLFNKYAPCLILIDEWVAYARQLHEDPDMPAGTFDTQFTFAQTVSEAAKAAKQTALIVSVPQSDVEVGGEWGREALRRLRNALGRVESSWRPATSEEGFEIVRRRLFQPLTNEQAVWRDAVARSFVDYYASQHPEFPSECRESEYERRIKMAYPIHPELFDRLYNDWSTLDRFQRTRGVLRFMAVVVQALWEGDSNLLIMPGTIPLDHSLVQSELARVMEEQWTPVIDADVDGENSLPVKLDRANPNLARLHACRRVARTIFMGSAPLPHAANRGIDERRIRLGCVQPGESLAVFGDALRRLSDRATYLYADGNRYWYSTQPTVTRLAEDRAAQLHEHDVLEEITRRLRREAEDRGEFSRVHSCVTSSDVPDEHDARMVILSPDQPHSKNQQDSPARTTAQEILEYRGNSPRNYRNTLVFLAPDATRLEDLKTAVRSFLAWTSICDEADENNLDAFQRKQAETKRKSADETVNIQIPETYQWLLVPIQPETSAETSWVEIRQLGKDSLATRASKKLINEDLLVTRLGGTRLLLDLNRVPLWERQGDQEGNHVNIKTLVDHFATFLYLPRLKNSNVLLDAIQDGVSLLTWEADAFAFAQGWDEKAQRYVGLQAGTGVTAIADGASVIVKASAAKAQMDAEAAPAATTDTDASPTTAAPPDALIGETVATVPESDGQAHGAPAYRWFHGTIKLDPLRVGRDASRIADEVIQHLTKLDHADVKVTLEIHADLNQPPTEKTVRDVRENCQTLNFENFGFEVT